MAFSKGFRAGYFLLLVMSYLLVSCQLLSDTKSTEINLTIQVDGRLESLSLPANSSVQDAVARAGLLLGPLDRINPQLSSIVTQNSKIIIDRVEEQFTDIHEIIPYEHQTIKNESLRKEEVHILQSGVNGDKLVTYKKVLENGVEISNIEFKSVVIEPAIPEITMIGVQAPFTPRQISGIIAYIDNGNAWIMEGSTGNRKPVVTTGDLDGKVLKVSFDREWLLYSRKTASSEVGINSLWVTRLNRENAVPIDLQINNVIHFADWIPNSSQTIIYSTGEPRSAAPGWYANNDLYYKRFFPNGTLGSAILKLEVNSGGIYGWWGTSFTWSRDGSKLAFSRPDGVGLVNLPESKLEHLQVIQPYETHSDWGWIPGISWSPYGDFLFYVSPKNGSNGSMGASENFTLTARSLSEDLTIPIIEETGLFANPSTSQFLPDGSYLVAFLHAIFPEQSATSRYRVEVIDQDGSNRNILFPFDGFPGVNPQPLFWTPDFQSGTYLALLYEGNLWLVDAKTKESFQITGDGLITNIHWR